MNRQLQQELKNYNFLEKIAVGYWVDAIDQQRWKVAQIVNIKSYAHRHVITLHFDGFPDKWDQDFELPASTKLAPFRRFTVPYTGPQGYSRLDVTRNLPNLDFTDPLKDLERLLKKKQLKPEFINQTLRGQIFVLVDNILTKKTQYPQETYKKCVQFLKAYIKAALYVLKSALQKQPEISKQNITDPNIIYVSPQHALVNSIPEFVFNMNSILSFQEKRVKFFVNNQINCPSNDAIKQMRQFFIENKGAELCQAILDFQAPPYRGFPWAIKKQLVVLLSNLVQNYQFPKIQDNRQIPQVLDQIYYLQNKNCFAPEIIEKKHVQLIVTLIKDGNFEGKLRGLNQIKKMTEKNILKLTLLVQQITSSKILYLITDSSTFNRELFRRSVPLFEFSERNKLLNQEIITRIINLHKDKHQQQLKGYYETLVYFAKFLEAEKCIKFYNLLQTFPFDQYKVTLIRDYTIKAINQHPVFRKKYMQKGTQFGILFFWRTIQSSQKYSEQLIEKTIQAFCSLISDIYFKDETEKYIKLAINGIKSKKNIDAYLKIVYHSIKNNRKAGHILQSLDDEANIVDSVITSLLNTKNFSEKAIQNVFEFLEEANHHVKKKMTVDHIKQLWKIPTCRTYLLKFMRKYRSSKTGDKSTQKILSKQLSDAQIKQIIQKIFLSHEMMDKYTDISDELYQTADELIIAYNSSKKFIDYNYKHTIRNIRAQQMFGLAFYLNIIANSHKQDMATKSAKRFIQFYLRVLSRKYYGASNQQKIESWMLCNQQLMKLPNRLYFSLSIFFEQVKGRMKSINILESSNVDLVVFLKGKNIKKNFSLPRYTSLWKLRQVIGEQFDIKNTNFDLFFPVKHTETDMDKQQDFSLALIDIPKDPAEPSVIITPSKQIHPHFIAIDKFHSQFSSRFGQKILQNMDTAPPEQQKNMLNILFIIPPIKSLQKKITKLDVNSREQILNSQNKSKLSYQLYIIDKVKDPQFAINFNKSKGIEQIIKILLTRTSSKASVKYYPEDYPILTKLLKLFTQMIKFYKMIKTPLPFENNALIQILKPPPQNQNQPMKVQIVDYFYQLIIAIQQIASYPQIKIATIIEHPVFTAVLQIVFFSNSDSGSAEKFPQTIISLCQKGNCIKSLLQTIQGFMNLNHLQKKKYTKQFFKTLVNLLEKSYYSNELLQKVIQYISAIMKTKHEDQSPDMANQLLFGWLSVMKMFIYWEVSNQGKLKFKESFEIFAKFIIQQGLFAKKPRFKTHNNRQIAFQILNNIPCEKFVYENINNILAKMIQKSTWRRQYQWYVKSFNKRLPEEQVGIKNLAATCYINSLLQQLFFIRKFSQPLLSVDGKAIDDKQNIVYQLQKIFAHLKYSENKTYSTESLCMNFILDGQPIDPRIQTDVDQFFHSLMDKLERNLIKIKQQDIIDNIFRGEYANLIVGQQCPHKSQRIEHFLSMRLEIMNKKSLNQALEQFIKGEVLEGDNAYFCEKCDKKVKALKRVCVKSLPQVLILTLKRFQFDFDKMQKFKLNTYCEFPQELDMFPYMREALYKDQQKMKPINYRYRLKGTIIHYGISEAGHYTSYIKLENGEWKYFDDDKISEFDVKDIKQQCFGGVEDNPYSDNSQKLKNSYVLIYEKVNQKPQKQSKPHPTILNQVQSQNHRNQDIKILFQDGLVDFVTDSYLKMPKAYLLYLHTVILRSQKRRKKLIKSYSNCITLFKDPNICSWYLNQFSENIIRQFLIYSHSQVSFFVASLVIECLKRVKQPEFIKRCMKCLQKRNMVPLNRVFQAAINSDQCYYKALGQFSFGDRVYRIIKQDKAPSSTNLAKISDINSQFGDPADGFSQKRDFKSPTQLFLAIEKFKLGNLSEAQIDQFSYRINKIHAQISFAKIAAIKLKDLVSLQSFKKSVMLDKFLHYEPKIDEEYSFLFYLILIRQLCLIKDESFEYRNQILAELYFIAMRQSLQGYKCMKLLLEGLFNIAFQNQVFLSKFSTIISSQKKVIKGIREWIKQSDRAYFNVKDKKIGYWRQVTQKHYYVPQSQLAAIDKDLKIVPQKYLSLFNAIIQMHQIQYLNSWITEPSVGDIVISTDGYQNVYEVIGRAGLLIQVKIDQDNSIRIVNIGDVTVLPKK